MDNRGLQILLELEASSKHKVLSSSPSTTRNKTKQLQSLLNPKMQTPTLLQSSSSVSEPNLGLQVKHYEGNQIFTEYK
jgi:hypothetical protein